MARWDPFEEIRRLERRMNRLFEEFWSTRPRLLLGTGETGIEPFRGRIGIREPYTDVIETEKEVIVTSEIPGVEKKDININVTEDRIEISAESKYETKEEKEGYVRKERSYGKFYRSLGLSSGIDPNKAKATYNNGVLEVKLPKIKTTKKTSVKVE